MNYEEIKAAVLGYSDRYDNAVATFYPSAVPVVEGRINSVLSTRLSLKDRTIPVTIAGIQEFSLPSDLLFLKQVKVLQNGMETAIFSYVSEQYLYAVIATNVSKPFYTVTNAKIKLAWSFKGDNSETIELRYEQLLPALTTGTSNWLSIANPQVYIFGLLVELFAFVKDADAAAAWEARFQKELDSIENTDYRTQWSGLTKLQTILG